jgi:histidyl-tRNA synthetase
MVSVFAGVVERAGYELVVPPMFEDLGVFQRIGESTDVVTKEMYDFIDKAGRRVALRPEHTAGVCRAFVQHRPLLPWKVWYAGSNFRYEKPQAGRFRQFDQVGVEALGSADPLLDVEVISLAAEFYAALGLRDVSLVVNSLGDAADRERYVSALREHFTSRAGELSEESRANIDRNPLRILDSKREIDTEAIADAPSMAAHLGPEARDHFDAVTAGLRALGVAHTLDEKLVRGLDYYVRTTFEFRSTALDSSQNAVGGGGRYDGLVESLGGPPTPGIGFALGVDRILLACDAEGAFPAAPSSVEVFVVDVTGGVEALSLTRELRRAGFGCERAFDARSMKSQMKSADRSGARWAVIVGPDEVRSASVVVRSLADSGQETVPRAELVSRLGAMRQREAERR